MWIKVLLALAVVAFSTLLGYLAATKWRQRRDFYTQMCLFHERYLNELGYARKPLKDFFKEYAYKGDFSKTVHSFGEERKSEVTFGYLTKEERAEFTNYLSMLGKGDAASQKGYFSAQTAYLTQKRESAQKEAKVRGELYTKLGLLAGLAAVILIV